MLQTLSFVHFIDYFFFKKIHSLLGGFAVLVGVGGSGSYGWRFLLFLVVDVLQITSYYSSPAV